VTAHSKPSTNIHAIIGRNGVGKTTLINAMIFSALAGNEGARFETESGWKGYTQISPGYFSNVVSISFSAFDPFNPLKHHATDGSANLKNVDKLYEEFAVSLGICLSEKGKRQRWLKTISTLESDDNFAEMELAKLADLSSGNLFEKASELKKQISSGHAIVLLTLTKLISCLEEKTLVLFDEPECHLHPPLLSALIRSLSELLYDRNAVAILATHSPVVLQEIPSSCVWNIMRSGSVGSSIRPDNQTFGENVGSLTRDVFGLEVSKSGFNSLLSQEAEKGSTYEHALESFSGQLGFEGRAILRSLINLRDKQ